MTAGRGRDAAAGGRGAAELFAGAGEMRALCRAHDWAATPLGAPEGWPPALRAAVQLVLASPSGMSLWCGPEYTLLYNDAYRRVLGAKHPGALGRSGAAVWAEIWPEIAPLFDRVRAGGPAVSAENVPFLVQRVDGGGLEEGWFDYALSAVRDERGAVVAVLSVASDTTARVRAERALAAGQARLARLLDAAPAVIAVYSGPEHVVTYVNPTWERVVGKPEALGRPFREVFPEMAESGLFERLTQVYETGEPYSVSEMRLPIRRQPGGPVEESYWDFLLQPQTGAMGEGPSGKGADILVHAVEVTAQVRARKEVERLLVASERTAAALAGSETRQAFLLALQDRLLPLDDPDRIQFEAARALGEHLRASRVGYAEIEADGEHSLVMRNYTNGARGIEGRYRVADYSPALIEALHAGRTLARDDIARDPTLTDAERAAHATLEIGATVDLPLIRGGRLVAVLFAHFREAHAWTADELTLLSDVAARTWDAVERARAEAALKAGEARLRLALDVAELGTWTWDLATGAGSLDARGAEIVGLPAGDLPDVASAQFASIHPDDLARTQAAAEAGIASGEPFDLEYRVVTPSGQIRHVASRARALPDSAGRAARLVGTNRDVTTEREAATERERLLEAAKAANRAKSEFLAIMSHELRTPLNAIGGYAELIELGIHGPVTEAQRTALERIQRSQRHLLGLIAGVLDYSRVEAAAVTYRLTSVPVVEAVTEAEVLVAPQLRGKGLGYAWSGAPPELAVRADREKLQQILLNLLGNAVKFTHSRDGLAGRVEVSCTVDEGEAGARVALHVRDTGDGIAPEQLERVFEPFVQADQRLTRAADGVGLGLAISRDLARGMGGDLTAESTPGVGSTFTLTLPRA